MKNIILFILAFFIAYSANTQNINSIKIGPAFNKKIKNKGINKENSFELIQDFINDDISFKKIKEKSTPLKNQEGQLTHEKYQQYYNGIKVENGIYMIHSNENKIVSVNGNIVPIKEANCNPNITDNEALEIAFDYFNTKIDDSESHENDLFSAKPVPEGELLFIIDSLNNLRLTYKFNIESFNGSLIYIDALTGEVCKTQTTFFYNNPGNSAFNVNFYKNVKISSFISNDEGQAATRYSGLKTIYTTYHTSWNYNLHNYNYGHNWVFDAEHKIIFLPSTNFYDNDNNWTSVEWDNTAMDNIALDVSWACWRIKDYMHDIIGIDSYEDNNGILYAWVHYGTNYPNAGSVGDNTLVFGDGDGIICGPYASLDIVAHEIGHKVNYHALDGNNLIPAINEGFSDIFSIGAEYYIAPEKEIWEHGEDVYLTNTITFTRSFSNPNSPGLHNLRYADTYGGDYWDESDHQNSTVLSHWFYILNEGKSGTNDIGNAFNVSGIDNIIESSQICYNVLDLYLLASSTFQDVKEQSISYIQATCGEISDESLNAMQAWYAVGVPGDCAVNVDNITINNSSPYVDLDVGDCEIEFSNVSYSTGTNAHYKAGSVTISSSFEVQAGVTLEIN